MQTAMSLSAVPLRIVYPQPLQQSVPLLCQAPTCSILLTFVGLHVMQQVLSYPIEHGRHVPHAFVPWHLHGGAISAPAVLRVMSSIGFLTALILLVLGWHMRSFSKKHLFCEVLGVAQGPRSCLCPFIGHGCRGLDMNTALFLGDAWPNGHSEFPPPGSSF